VHKNVIDSGSVSWLRGRGGGGGGENFVSNFLGFFPRKKKFYTERGGVGGKDPFSCQRNLRRRIKIL